MPFYLEGCFPSSSDKLQTGCKLANNPACPRPSNIRSGPSQMEEKLGAVGIRGQLYLKPT